MKVFNTRGGYREYLGNALILLLLAVSGWSICFPVTNTDIWWHLAAGREILTRGSLLYHDVFSYTLDNPEWIDLHWLFQIAAFTVYSVGGISGLLVVKVLLVVITGLIVAFTFRRKWFGVTASLLWVVSVFSAKYLMLLRPSLVTLFMIALYFFFIERHRESGRLSWIAALIPLQVIWTNSQGLFILGPGILLMFLIEKLIEYRRHSEKSGLFTFIKDNKMFLVISLLLLLSPLLNPYGIKGFLFPFELFMRINPFYENVFSDYISENTPLFKYGDETGQYLMFFTVFSVLMYFSFIVKKGEIRFFHVLSALSFGFLALIAKRNLALFTVVFSLITAYNSSDPEKRFSEMFRKRYFMVLSGSIAGILILLQSMILVKASESYPSDSCISPFRVPVNAVKYLKKNPAEGKVFSTMRYGGYLIFSMFPGKRVNIDGRMIIRDAEFFRNYLELIREPGKGFDEYRERFGIERVLLPLSEIRIYNSLRKWLCKSEDWSVELIDGESVLYKYTPDCAGILPLRVYEDRALSVIDEREWSNDVIRREARKGLYKFLSIVK
ncbi:MAG: hypothetical protein ACOCSE_06115 [Chitinivibrionales bacterium]